MNRRTLLRHVTRAATAHAPAAGHSHSTVHAAVVFPPGAFDPLPTWSAGKGFRPLNGQIWFRPDHPGAETGQVIVTGVGPKEMPAADGGTWTDPEVWTAQITDTYPSIWTLLDKGHRITGVPAERILKREVQTEDHPATLLGVELWQLPFTLDLDALLYGVFADRWYLGLAWTPDDAWDATVGDIDLRAFTRLLAYLIDTYRARVHIYAERPGRQHDVRVNGCPVPTMPVEWQIGGDLWKHLDSPSVGRGHSGRRRARAGAAERRRA